MEDSVRAYATEKLRLDYADIVTRFGEPRVVVESHVEEMQTPELMDHLRIGRKVVGIVAAAAMAIVILWTCVVSIAWAEHRDHDGGYFEEKIVNVTIIPNEEG